MAFIRVLELKKGDLIHIMNEYGQLIGKMAAYTSDSFVIETVKDSIYAESEIRMGGFAKTVIKNLENEITERASANLIDKKEEFVVKHVCSVCSAEELVGSEECEIVEINFCDTRS